MQGHLSAELLELSSLAKYFPSVLETLNHIVEAYIYIHSVVKTFDSFLVFQKWLWFGGKETLWILKKKKISVFYSVFLNKWLKYCPSKQEWFWWMHTKYFVAFPLSATKGKPTFNRFLKICNVQYICILV